MVKVSDEIRNWCDLCGGIIDSYDREKLCALIDRVDAELIELPKDTDGVPIHLGDTVYAHGFPDGNGGATCKVCSIEFNVSRDNKIELDADGVVTYRTPSSLTHKLPDSFERIADDIDSHYENHTFISDDTIHDWAVRIRKLAKREGE